MTEAEKLNIREFNEIKEIETILEEKLKKFPQINSIDEIPDPLLFKDMEKAVNIFIDAVANNQRICFILDSDMDGLGCYTQTWFFFKNYFPYTNLIMTITNRKEGYGFLPLHVDKFPADLYITADNGITAKPAIEAAKVAGAKVIINDHHLHDPEVWPLGADAVIDPHQPECKFPYKEISGSVVLWFFFKAIADKYRLDMDNYNEFLGELALTTLSDVMPIDRHLNRFFVTDFLVNQKIKESPRAYAKTFITNKNENPTAEDISFGFTPLINATQRVTKADDGANFLIQEDENASQQWFEYLNNINDIRKERQQKLLDYIEYRYKDFLPKKGQNGARDSLDFICIPGQFHKEYKGVLGIIAGRLAEKYKKPTIVLNLNEETGDYSGSGRSIGDINILGMFRDNDINPLIKNVGGHKVALGITVHKDNFNEFYKIILEKASKIDYELFKPKISTMGYIDINKIDIDLYHKLQKFEPFGEKFPRPAFTTKVTVKSTNLIGKQKNHLTLNVQDEKGMLTFKALWFFHDYEPRSGEEYYLTFKPDIDNFRGQEKLSLRVIGMEKVKN
jgi:single-stranded-DNA-specific exonuclease